MPSQALPRAQTFWGRKDEEAGTKDPVLMTINGEKP